MKQKDALNILKMGHNVYLTGQAGSGKTHVLNEYIKYLKARGVSVGVTASTGIAATHINGMTIHSWSGIGIRRELSEMEIDALESKQYLYKRISKTKVLIIDEISMLHPDTLDSIERVCRAFKRSKKPFGGIQVIFSGDFFQLPPITRGGEKSAFALTSVAWRTMGVRVCYLNEQFRQDKDNDILFKILNEIRSGKVGIDTMDVFRSRYNKPTIAGSVPTRLYTHNIDVDRLNNEELAKIELPEKTFHMESAGKERIAETLKKSVLASEELKLKVGALVMFVKNNFDYGYANGTLGTVVSFNEFDVPIVKTVSGREIKAEQMEWSVEEDGKKLAQVKQIPLRLAWAITIHKSQGMSLDAAEIDLSKSFVPGQGYVALSRLRSIEGLKLMGLGDMALKVHRDVLVFDKDLLAQSEQNREWVCSLDLADIQKGHRNFVVISDGTIDDDKIKQNEKEAEKDLKDLEKIKSGGMKIPKISTREKTRELIEDKKLSIEDAAKERGMTAGTIINHLEQLKADGVEVKMDHTKMKDGVKFLKIKIAFDKSEDEDRKLSPIYKALGGEFTYDEIRLTRLFLE